MNRAVRRAAGSAALAALALTASGTCPAQEVVAYAEARPEIDYEAFWAAVPRVKELARESLVQARELLEVMERLSTAEKDEAKLAEARAAARELLLRYRDNKATLVRTVDVCLKAPRDREDDLEILRRLRETELVGISWDKTKFIDCLRDLAGALRVRFLMHPDVLKFNTIEASFPRAPADGILKAIATGFDCDYYVYNGEVVVIKTLKRNDIRIQQFLDKHPDWKYWRPQEVKEVEDDL